MLDMTGFQQEILSATNDFRVTQGKGPLKLSSKVKILFKHFKFKFYFLSSAMMHNVGQTTLENPA